MPLSNLPTHSEETEPMCSDHAQRLIDDVREFEQDVGALSSMGISSKRSTRTDETPEDRLVAYIAKLETEHLAAPIPGWVQDWIRSCRLCWATHGKQGLGGALLYLAERLESCSTPSTSSSTPEQGVYGDIRAERARQDAQWGGPGHDNEHTAFDWRKYRLKFEARANDMLDSDFEAVYEPADGRIALVKIAALAVAQIEALDRKHPRALPQDTNHE